MYAHECPFHRFSLSSVLVWIRCHRYTMRDGLCNGGVGEAGTSVSGCVEVSTFLRILNCYTTLPLSPRPSSTRPSVKLFSVSLHIRTHHPLFSFNRPLGSPVTPDSNVSLVHTPALTPTTVSSSASPLTGATSSQLVIGSSGDGYAKYQVYHSCTSSKGAMPSSDCLTKELRSRRFPEPSFRESFQLRY